ncbi:MAG: carboxylesterase/lipase family protein [Nevskiales bacterium]
MNRLLRVIPLAILLPFCADAQQVDLNSGALEGERLGQVERYLGIPYAAPPVGELRWRAPRPVDAWIGVRKATAPGPACTQIGGLYASNDPATFDRPYGSEDCLYLNVWTPAERQGPRPVLFFIHGGSGVAGDSAFPIYDGARLAAENQIVVVTVNYRLGVLGSLHLPALKTGVAAEDSGNYFLLDLIQALDWVQANIAAFGGDPRNVTIAGHSAGAGSVLALLRSPLAPGKFQRAISYSGLPFSSSPDQAREHSEALLEALMRQDGSIRGAEALAQRVQEIGEAGLRHYLLGKSGAQLVEAGRGLPPGGGYLADGTVLPQNPQPDELPVEVSSPVPLMIGTVRDEISLLALTPKLSPAQRWELLSGETATATTSAYELLGFWKHLGYRVSRFFGECILDHKIEGLYDRLAPKLPALYVYTFDWDAFPQPWRGQFGAFHGLDVPFVFGNFIVDQPSFARFAWTAENAGAREALHRRMAAALRGFVESGNPNAHVTPNHPAWATWDARRAQQVWN